MVHPYMQWLTRTFLFDFGGQKLDNYYDLFMLALFENIRPFVLRVENYSIRTKWVFVSPLLIILSSMIRLLPPLCSTCSGVCVPDTDYGQDVCNEEAGEETHQEAERRVNGAQRKADPGKARQQLCGKTFWDWKRDCRNMEQFEAFATISFMKQDWNTSSTSPLFLNEKAIFFGKKRVVRLSFDNVLSIVHRLKYWFLVCLCFFVLFVSVSTLICSCLTCSFNLAPVFVCLLSPRPCLCSPLLTALFVVLMTKPVMAKRPVNLSVFFQSFLPNIACALLCRSA